MPEAFRPLFWGYPEVENFFWFFIEIFPLRDWPDISFVDVVSLCPSSPIWFISTLYILGWSHSLEILFVSRRSSGLLFFFREALSNWISYSSFYCSLQSQNSHKFPFDIFNNFIIILYIQLLLEELFCAQENFYPHIFSWRVNFCILIWWENFISVLTLL